MLLRAVHMEKKSSKYICRLRKTRFDIEDDSMQSNKEEKEAVYR